MINVIAVGKKHEDWTKSGVERYQKRLRRPFDVEWILLPHSSLEGQAARQEESQRISQRIPDDARIILLDERGAAYDSAGFSKLIEDSSRSPRGCYMVIGGAYGVSDALFQRADAVVSLSAMVFPHQLVRLLVIEQLYRAQEIARGGKYHHE